MLILSLRFPLYHNKLEFFGVYIEVYNRMHYQLGCTLQLQNTGFINIPSKIAHYQLVCTVLLQNTGFINIPSKLGFTGRYENFMGVN